MPRCHCSFACVRLPCVASCTALVIAHCSFVRLPGLCVRACMRAPWPMQVVVMGLITGSLFLQLDKTLSGSRSFFGAAFLAVGWVGGWPMGRAALHAPLVGILGIWLAGWAAARCDPWGQATCSACLPSPLCAPRAPEGAAVRACVMGSTRAGVDPMGGRRGGRPAQVRGHHMAPEARFGHPSAMAIHRCSFIVERCIYL